jgi:hypothetical protein
MKSAEYQDRGSKTREAVVHQARWWGGGVPFFMQQPTMFRCIPGRVGGDFYDDDVKDEDDNNDRKRRQQQKPRRGWQWHERRWRPHFLTQQPTLVGCIPGWVGGFLYDYDENN